MAIVILAQFTRDQLMIEDHVLHASQQRLKFCKKMVIARLVPNILEQILTIDSVSRINVVIENTSLLLVHASNVLITLVPMSRTWDASLINAMQDKFKPLMEDVLIAQFIKDQMLPRESVWLTNARIDNIS